MAKISKRDMNYRIDFAKLTLTMTAEFADRAYDSNTEEYEILTRLQQKPPMMIQMQKVSAPHSRKLWTAMRNSSMSMLP